MEERVGEAFAGTEQFTVIGRQLQVGDLAPDFCLDYLDLADLVVRTISLAEHREQPRAPGLPVGDTTVGSPSSTSAIRCLHLYRE